MNAIAEFLGVGRTPKQTAGTARRLKLKALRREVATADGEEKDALTAELALLQAEADLQTKEKLAAYYVAAKSPRASQWRQEATRAKSTLGAIKARLSAMLGFAPAPTTPAPAPAPAPTPPSTPPVRASAPSRDAWRTVNAGSSPEAVEAAMLDLCAYPSRALGPDWAKDPTAMVQVLKRADSVLKFMDSVLKIDPTGKVIERVEGGTPSERKEAARIIGGILQRIASEI